MSKKDTVITVEKTNSPSAAHRTAPPPPPAAPSTERSRGSQNDLEDLREIFWGNHIRNTEGRFNAVEARIETVNRTLTTLLNEKFADIADSSKNSLVATHTQLNSQIEAQAKQAAQELRLAKQEINNRLSQQADNHDADLRKTSRELMAYVDEQNAKQAAQLRQAQKEFNERIDQLASDLITQLGKVQKELTLQITRLNDEQNEHLNSARAEAHRQNNDLREEMLKLTAALDDKATARHDLGQMYMEIGRRLYNG